jgi:hypothetical protein
MGFSVWSAVYIPLCQKLAGRNVEELSRKSCCVTWAESLLSQGLFLSPHGTTWPSRLQLIPDQPHCPLLLPATLLFTSSSPGNESVSYRAQPYTRVHLYIQLTGTWLSCSAQQQRTQKTRALPQMNIEQRTFEGKREVINLLELDSFLRRRMGLLPCPAIFTRPT